MTKQKKINAQDVLRDLRSQKNEVQAKTRAGFFQVRKNGYGEGDVFLGLTVPQQRKVALKYYRDIGFGEVEKLLRNKYHEARYVALAVLKERYKKKNADVKEKELIVQLYLKNIQYINNWDLVDTSAPHITGEHWFNNSRKVLWKLAKSKKLWHERIAVLSTHYFIRQGHFGEIIRLAGSFLEHKHDLMHKAVGWMLREAGKRDIDVLYGFLDKHHKKMPRTMLRYAIEKLPEKKRMHYMGKENVF